MASTAEDNGCDNNRRRMEESAAPPVAATQVLSSHNVVAQCGRTISPHNSCFCTQEAQVTETAPPRKRSREGQKGGKRDKRLRRAATRMTEQDFAEATAKVGSSSHNFVAQFHRTISVRHTTFVSHRRTSQWITHTQQPRKRITSRIGEPSKNGSS